MHRCDAHQVSSFSASGKECEESCHKKVLRRCRPLVCCWVSVVQVGCCFPDAETPHEVLSACMSYEQTQHSSRVLPSSSVTAKHACVFVHDACWSQGNKAYGKALPADNSCMKIVRQSIQLIQVFLLLRYNVTECVFCDRGNAWTGTQEEVKGGKDMLRK